MNYFEYFSEIEELFSRRRGSLLMLSTLDWALIETWREAGIPLAAVLRGINEAFDKHDARKHTARTRKVNGLAWCAQAVMQATEELQEAAVGMAKPTAREPQDTGFETERVARFLTQNADAIGKTEGAGGFSPLNQSPQNAGFSPGPLTTAYAATAQRLRELALEMRSETPLPLDALDRILTILEEKLVATLTASAPEAELVALRTQADRELAPYRAKMGAVQMKQVQQQFLLKRLLEARKLPRLSLFYMGHES